MPPSLLGPGAALFLSGGHLQPGANLKRKERQKPAIPAMEQVTAAWLKGGGGAVSPLPCLCNPKSLPLRAVLCMDLFIYFQFIV